MKRKVLAQRKFAQGVFVPSSGNERRNEPTPNQTRLPLDRSHKITTFNLKASQYLDFVTFQNIHHHESKWDREISDDLEEDNHTNDYSPALSSSKEFKSSSSPEATSVSNSAIPKEIRSQEAVVMLNKLDIEASLNLRFDKIKDKQSTSGRSSSNSTIKKNFKPSLLIRKKIAKRFQANSNKLNLRSTRLHSSGTSTPTTDSFDTEKSMRLRKRAAVKLTSRLVKKKKVSTSLSSDLSSDDDTPLNKLCTNKKIKDNTINTRQRENILSNKMVLNRELRKSTRKPTAKAVDILDVLYNRNEIQDWVDKTISATKNDVSNKKNGTSTDTTSNSDDLDDNAPLRSLSPPSSMPSTVTPPCDELPTTSNTFKMPLPVTVKAKRKSSDKSNDRCPSPCPSNSIQNVRTLDDIGSITLNYWQKICKNCHILDKIRDQMHSIVEKKNKDAEDIYNFQCDSDSDNEALINYRHRIRTPPENHSLYLDLFEENSPYIIQIMNCKQLDKSMMSARILPRSQVDPHLVKRNAGDSLNNHTFLKDILSTLKGDSKPIEEEEEELLRKNISPKKIERPFIKNHKRKSENNCVFPRPNHEAIMVEAPVYKPTAEEFENPLVYIESIRSEAEKFGICKIKPPADFKPTCNVVPEDMNFTSCNQYICKMYMRWASASREICAIKSYLATQNVVFKRPPLIDGIEVNLAKLFHKVQRMGGLKEVIEKKKWSKVAEEMNYSKSNNIETKLDRIYCKYLLPYDTLTCKERQDITRKVEIEWNKRFNKMLFRARNPFYRQMKLLGEVTSEDEDEDEMTCLEETEDCVLPGRYMNLKTFKNIAQRSMEVNFPNIPHPSTSQVEQAYWEYVLFGEEHICVNTASIDTGEKGYGFTKNKSDPYSKHPWNLKVLSNNQASVLRSMGPVLSATVPALHLGMVFTTSCWHRDPHGLPWIEYLHEGAPKIWYGIPNDWSENFRKAVETLAPAYCQNKAIWLPSDIAMFPPKLLIENKVSLSKITQEPGEFIVVFPKAYSSSICTGFTISESVYFAPQNWLMTMQNDFQDVRDSCEPTMFSLEHLLISIASDPRSSQSVKTHVHNTLDIILRDELCYRQSIDKYGMSMNIYKQPPKKKSFLWNVGEHTECDVCRRTLFLSKVSGIIGKKSDLCLQHAVRLLEMRTRAQLEEMKKEVSVVLFYSEEVLEDLMKSLRLSIM